MSYLLDTNAWSVLLKSTSPALLRRVRSTPTTDLILSAVTWTELQYGLEIAPPNKRASLAAKLTILASEIGITGFEEAAATAAAVVRGALKRAGTPIGPYDALLAGHALALGATMVTNNTREFRRVPGLVVEDWTELG